MMSAWFFPEQVPSGSMRLFCFPYAGGGASVYRGWTKNAALGVVPVQLPGRENRMREAPLCSLRETARHVARAVMPYADRRYAFFGHSLGARIAFEVVRFLRKEGWPLPEHLFVSGCRAPEMLEPAPLHNLGEEVFLKALSRYGGTQQSLLNDRELMRFFMPLLRADFAMDETYLYVREEPLPVAITAFYGSEDREATRGEVAAWAAHTEREFSLCEVGGGHFYLIESASLLQARIRNTLGI